MLEEKDLKALEELFDKKLEPINGKIDKMQEKLEAIDTRLEVVEANTEFMIRWLDAVQDSANQARMAVGMPPRNFPE